MKQRKPVQANIFILLWRRLATISLWYCALALSLIVVLLGAATYQPAVVSNMVIGAPALTWLTAAERAHMQDVHELVRDALLISLSAAVTVGSYWYNRRLDSGMTRGAFAMMLALCVMLIPFPWTFRFFHAAFFPQGNWQFPADSWLIITFPIWFFALVAVVWFSLALLGLWLLHRYVKTKNTKN